MSFDVHTNFGYSVVVTPPSPATSGNSLTVRLGEGANFSVNQNATVWPNNTLPTKTNAEIVRITAISGDTLTINRSQESSTAQSITAGYQISNNVTAKALTDIESATIAYAVALG